MPLYSYQCTNCGVAFERQQKFDDKPIKRCPECNKSTVRRVIQPAGIIFKGSGWYKTDSRSSSSSTVGSSSSSSSKSKKTESKSAEGGGSESKSSESKSESKASESKPSASSSSSSSSAPGE